MSSESVTSSTHMARHSACAPAPNPECSTPVRARYVMIGGFLGAGKTTAVAKLARHLHDRGLRVGLITNDQGSHLVDTAMLESRGFPVEEISGGCFCCRFNSLVEAAAKLTQATAPDVFIAEPVGSCTDLVATVTYPLRRIYGDQFAIAPLSVLVDPVRALRIFGLEEGGQFSEKVTYIYRKQLEEADVIIINKCDLLEPSRLARLRQTLAASFPRAELFEVSARHGTGLEQWFERISGAEQLTSETMVVDYDCYAEGEALLGWLNCTIGLASKGPFEGNDLLRQFALEIQQRLQAAGGELAHLKMTLDPEQSIGDLAVANLVRNDYVPELSQELLDPLENGQLIVNLRAEASPDILRTVVIGALEQTAAKYPGLETKLEHLEHFRPGRPVPTHRVVN